MRARAPRRPLRRGEAIVTDNRLASSIRDTAILVHRSPGEERVALFRDGKLCEFLIDRPHASDGIGDRHVGRMVARVPAMAGAFVALHDATAFLPDSDGAAAAFEGDWIAVRITRAAQGGKGPRVSARGMTPPAILAGPARRLSAGPTAAQELQAAWPDAAVRHAPFEDVLEAQLDALSEPSADLPCGLRVHFAVTPALTAIDLDGAQSTGARRDKPTTQRDANLMALPELCRHITLRNFSGAILVDFAGMPSRGRKSLAPALEAALAADRLRPRLTGFTPLGFAEITRPRVRPPLHEKLQSPHGIGLAALRRAAREAEASPPRRLALRAAPAVIGALREDTAALSCLARQATYPLALREDRGLTTGWFIEDGDA